MGSSSQWWRCRMVSNGNLSKPTISKCFFNPLCFYMKGGSDKRRIRLTARWKELSDCREFAVVGREQWYSATSLGWKRKRI